jgi:methionyl-tRNA formyltransferase
MAGEAVMLNNEEELDLWPTVDPIVPCGEPVLRRKAHAVKKVNSRIQKLLDRMAEIMAEAGGAGLAAPQVGESVRVVVIDVGEGLIELVNPQIVREEGTETAYEGCLSVPGYLGKVERSAWVQVEALDRNGHRIWIEGNGMLARALQHEIDHLNGVLFIDRAESLLKLPAEARLSTVFMGTPEFGAAVLEELAESHAGVEAVVTQPDRPRGRGQKLQPSAVKQVAAAYELPVLQPQKVSEPEFVEKLRELEPDVIVTAAFGQLIPPEVLAIPEKGCINVHASLLPEFRGAAPIHRALLAGEDRTGITIMYMDEGLDTGDIMLQEQVAIEPGETAGSLHDKLAELGAVMTIRALRLLAEGEAPRTPQEDEAATYAPRVKKEEARIDWSESAEYLERMFRAFDPWPGAYSKLNGKRLKVFRAEVTYDEELELETPTPGTIARVTTGALFVKCGEGFAVLEEVQPAGSKRMSVEAFLQGHDVEVGDSFE